MSINKMVKDLKLIEFDMINKKSLLQIYQKTLTEKENTIQNVFYE